MVSERSRVRFAFGAPFISTHMILRPTPHDLLVLASLMQLTDLSEDDTALLESLHAQLQWSPRQARELDALQARTTVQQD